MKILFTSLFIMFLMHNTGIAQTKALKLINNESSKEVILKNKSNVKAKTLDGRKIRGKLFIKDDLVYVNNILVDLENIDFIKKDPLLIRILSSTALIYAGAVTLGIAAIIVVFADTSAVFLALPAAAAIYTGIKAPNFNKKYSLNKGWTIQLVTIPDKS